MSVCVYMVHNITDNDSNRNIKCVVKKEKLSRQGAGRKGNTKSVW